MMTPQKKSWNIQESVEPCSQINKQFQNRRMREAGVRFMNIHEVKPPA